VLYLVGNCINLYQFGEGFLLVFGLGFMFIESFESRGTCVEFVEPWRRGHMTTRPSWRGWRHWRQRLGLQMCRRTPDNTSVAPPLASSQMWVRPSHPSFLLFLEKVIWKWSSYLVCNQFRFWCPSHSCLQISMCYLFCFGFICSSCVNELCIICNLFRSGCISFSVDSWFSSLYNLFRSGGFYSSPIFWKKFPLWHRIVVLSHCVVVKSIVLALSSLQPYDSFISWGNLY
jgi:hypothetical protein